MKEMFRSIGRGFLRHHRPMIVLVAIAAVVLVLINATFLAFSRYPTTCLMCHYMEPYYAQWQESSHSEVSCVKCHPLNPAFITVSTLRYLTDNYNPRPMADVPDRSCLSEGCHERRLIEGDVTYKESIRFDHAGHMDTMRRGRTLRCTSCHSQIVQGEHIAVTEKVCFLCHFKGTAEGTSLGGCTSCHGEDIQVVEHEGFRFSHDSYLEIGVECNQCHLQVAEGDGAVPSERCFQCHVERIESYSDLDLVHSVHVEDHGVDCFKCHEPIDHGDIKMISALEVSCESCHESLHTPQKEMYMGTGGIGVSDVPSRMFSAQVTCDGCHTHPLPARGEGLEAEKASCVACHGQGYDHMVDDWIGALDDAAGRVGEGIEATRRAVRSQGSPSLADSLVNNATFDYEFVREGRGVHNVAYAVSLLKKTVDCLDEARSALPSPLEPLSRDRLLGTSDGYCMIMCHTRIGVPETLEFGRADFPHSIHSDGIGIECTECHSPKKHKMGVITRSACKDCHHVEVELECSTCHQSQHDLYTGHLVEIGRQGEPDFMAQAEISCGDCHSTDDERPPMEQAREACVVCHDESYEESLDEWDAEGRRAADELLELEDELRHALEDKSTRKRIGAEAREALAQAESLRAFLDGAQPVHNFMLAQQLLEESSGRIRGLLEIAGKEAD